jgi:hypothetical protein
MKPVLILLGLAFLVQFKINAPKSLATYHELYHSPQISTFISLKETLLKSMGPNDVIVIDSHEFDALRFMISQTAYTLRPECAEVGPSSAYCTRRKDWKNFVHPKSGNVWSIPIDTKLSSNPFFFEVK